MRVIAYPGWVLALTMLAMPSVALAVDSTSAPEAVAGMAEVDGPVVDPDFGVQVEALGLRREVQMWQWQRDADGFSGTWSTEPIDASGFPAGYANPGEPAYGSAEWFAGQVHLSGRRLAPKLLAGLPGWETVPAEQAAAALAPNLAVVFQPDAGWLSSSAEPDSPHIGDLRIRWQRLPAGPLHGELLADGQRWVAATPAAPLARGQPPQPAAGDDPVAGLPGGDPPDGGLGWLAWALLAFMLVGGFVLYRRNR